MSRVPFRLSISAAALLSLPTPAEVPRELLTSPLAQAFGAARSIGAPQLSPDGSRMIFLQQNETGASELRVLDFASGAIHTPMIGVLDGQDIDWCIWGNATRVVCSLADINHRRGGGFAATQPTQTTYIAIDDDGTDVQRLTRLCQNGIDRLPDDPQRIFVSCDVEAVYLNLYSNQIVDQKIDESNVRAVVSDGHGLVRLLNRSRGVEHRWYARRQLNDEWEPFRIINRLEFDDPFQPAGFGENLDEALHVAWNSGTWSLFAVDIAAGFPERVVFSHPVVDVTHVDRIGAHSRVVAAAYDFNGPQRFIIDERATTVHDFVAARLPDRSIEVVDESWDQNSYLVRARFSDRAGEFYRVDMAGQKLENVGAEYSHLSGIPLAPSQTIEITGADGSRFSAHLTLPANRDGPVPAVLIPRGEPSPLDIESPHYLVQFLAFSGYAVLRVNQRGPSEYGFSWITDRAIISRQQAATDIRRAGEYLVETGVALPGKVCALGSGLGAYVAVMTSIAHPDSLQCIVSIRGALNPPVARIYEEPLINPLLEEPSTARQADDIEASMLLFDGTMTAQSENMETLLRRAGQEVHLVDYDHVDPQIGQSAYRIDMLVRIGDFLRTQIGATN